MARRLKKQENPNRALNQPETGFRLEIAKGLKSMKKFKRRTSKSSRLPRRRETDRIDDGIGPECPSCKRPTQRWRHPDHVKLALTKGKPVYRYWFQCMHRECKTRQIMPKEQEAVFYPNGTQAPTP
jgi:hypothetical protein